MANSNLIVTLVAFGLLFIFNFWALWYIVTRHIWGTTQVVFYNLVDYYKRYPASSLEDRDSNVVLMNAEQMMKIIPADGAKMKKW